MAAPVTSLLRNLSSARALIDSLFSAEKAKIPIIKSQANDSFQIAYQQLQNFRRNVNSLENKTSEHSELTISAAETAFVTENYSIARELIEEFLLQTPQEDQFYCRAKIVLGLLIDHEAKSTYGEVNIQQRKLALKELQTALRVALSPENKERYQFILFNISIECWKIVRQFLRKGRAKYFKEEMVQICQSLETLKTVDKSWLISFLSGTAYCLEDGEDPKKAIEFLDKALVLAEELVADLSLKESQKLEQVSTFSKQIDELQRLIHLEEESEENKTEERPREEEAKESPGLAGLMQQVQTLQKQLTETKDDLKALSEAKVPLQESVMRLHFQKIYAFPSEGKKLLSTPQVPPLLVRHADLLPASDLAVASDEMSHHNPLDVRWLRPTHRIRGVLQEFND
jgi:tetratricopeptide (TPR) repeat protein